MLVCNIEEIQACADSWIEDVRTYVEFATSPVALLAEVLTERGFARSTIGIELGYLSTRYYRELEVLLPAAQIVDCGPLLDEVRMVKTPAEVERLRDAARTHYTRVRELPRKESRAGGARTTSKVNTSLSLKQGLTPGRL